MRIFLDLSRRTLQDEEGNSYRLGLNYDLPGSPGYRFHTYEVAEHFVVTLHGARRQSVRAPLLGPGLVGETNTQRYIFTLEPGKAIWPISEVVKKLLDSGIKRAQICPMSDEELRVELPAGSDPDMASDGQVYRREVRATGMSRFRVTGATWAAQFTGCKIVRVSLWMEAANSVHTLTRTIDRIGNGQFTTSYLR